MLFIRWRFSCIFPPGTNRLEQSSLQTLVWFLAGAEALRKAWGLTVITGECYWCPVTLQGTEASSTAKEPVAPKGENSILGESVNLGVTLATVSVIFFSVAQWTWRKEGFILAHDSKVQSMTAGKSWWQGLKAAGLIACAVSHQRATDACAWLPSSTSDRSRFQPLDDNMRRGWFFLFN